MWCHNRSFATGSTMFYQTPPLNLHRRRVLGGLSATNVLCTSLQWLPASLAWSITGGGWQLRIEKEPKALAAEALRMSSASSSETNTVANGSSELPNLHQLTNGQEKLERLSSDGRDHIVPDLATRQYLVVMRHGERVDEVDSTWSKQAARPFDPPLTANGEQQAKEAAKRLEKFKFKEVYMSPFLRCMQTASICATEMGIPPEAWTVDCTVGEFLNPRIMVKNGAKLPHGHINDWFFNGGDLASRIQQHFRPEVAQKVHVGETQFQRFPENLLNSRARFMQAFEDIADAAEGEDVLIVTHGDGVNASVSRMFPWAIVYPVKHTGFTVASRNRGDDGIWSAWELESKSGENGVWWNQNLRSVYTVVNAGARVYSTTSGVVGRVLRGGKHKVTSFARGGKSSSSE